MIYRDALRFHESIVSRSVEPVFENVELTVCIIDALELPIHRVAALAHIGPSTHACTKGEHANTLRFRVRETEALSRFTILLLWDCLVTTLVELSADVSVFFFASAWWLRADTDSRADWWAYALGLVTMVTHVVLAYAIAHQWSHQAALAHTALETASVVGFAMPAGLYANFLFLFVYLADVCWCFRQEGWKNRHPRWLAYAVDIFLVSIVLMATIVFESGWIRWLAALATVSIGIRWKLLRPALRRP